MISEVCIPRLNPNEDLVLVTDVLVAEGDWVSTGDELFVLETSKTSVAVEAEFVAVVRRVTIESGLEYPVGHIALVLADAMETPLPEQQAAQEAPAAAPAPASTAKERLLRKRNRQRNQAHPGVQPKNVQAMEAGELPWVRAARAALSLQGDTEHLAWREISHNNRQGLPPTMTLGRASSIKAKRLVLEPGASIGDQVKIEAEDLYIGACARIEQGVRIVTSECIISDGAYIGREAEVDVSGGKSSLSRLLAGPASLISPGCFVNTCREVVLEEESALSPRAMVFTHRFWQSVLEGYDVAFLPVRLCKQSWIGACCNVLPGVTIGEGAVVVSNSTVASDVPAGVMAGGVPATVLRPKAYVELSPERRHSILAAVLDDFARHLERKGLTVEKSGDHDYRVTMPGGKRRSILFSAQPPTDVDILVSLEPCSHVSARACFDLARNVFSGELDPLAHELRNFLRRRGIRLTPHGWDASFTKGIVS